MSEPRVQLLARMISVAAGTRTGAPVVLGIRAGIGFGKTWLLDRLAEQLPPDTLVLRCVGHPAETELPYAAVHALISPLLGRLGELPVRQAEAVTAALAIDPGTPRDPLALSAGLHGLITLGAESRPVIVLVDDLQWLDEPSRLALTFAARRLRADAVFMVFAGRPGDDRPWPVVEEHVINLWPVSESESRGILAAAYPDLSAAAARELSDRAGGLPLALVQLPAELNQAQRSGEEPLPTALRLGTRLEQFYSTRMRHMGQAGRVALALASLEELDLASLKAALAELGGDLTLLAEAERSGLLQIDESGCRFSHPTVRSAAQAAVGYSDIQAARRAILAVLPKDSPRRARHLDALADGINEEAATALDSAAADAWSRSAFSQAASAWERSAARTSDRERSTLRLGQAVEAHLRAGSGAPLVGLLQRLASDADSPEEEAKWLSLLQVTGLHSDLATGAPDRERQLAAHLAPTQPSAASTLLTTCALTMAISGWFGLAREMIDELRTLLPDYEFPAAEALVHDIVDVLTGRPGSGAILRSDWSDELSDAEVSSPATPVSPATTILAWMGESDDALRIIDRVRTVLHARGQVSLLGLSLGQRAVILDARGEWAEAAASYQSAVELILAGDFTGPLPHLRLRHAWLLAARGEHERAREIVSEMKRSAQFELPIHRHLTLCVEGQLELGAGNAAAAAARLTEAAACEREMGLVEPAFLGRFADYFDAMWRLDRHAEAVSELDDFEQRAHNADRISSLAIAARCRAIAGDAAGADAAFSHALDLHAASGDPFQTARTHLAFGQSLRRRRRKAEAIGELHLAKQMFERLGATPWLAIVIAELTACGERRAHDAGAAGPLSELTPRELEVALTVAAGASNPEAAARLFISRRTVEYHLAGVFRKLGVTSRTGLSEAVRSAESPGSA
ncbi:helix-turn-helix transcriptional regulator [Glaciibacter superstes]|uniref:helix-turn-helix transcriptional regulator n=1 Tax=Glaciibacter superstes TaxID=501023 RepID=UPI000A0617B4|nr:LuxR family transcriptional regulator [Glaciibacter superstes]